MMSFERINVLVLAGGRGNRMNFMTDNSQKSMLPVSRKPLLELAIAPFLKLGAHLFSFCVGYRDQDIRNYFRDGNKYGIRITYFPQDPPYGVPGKAIQEALRHLDSELVFCINGDTILRDKQIEDLLAQLDTRSADGVFSFESYGKAHRVCYDHDSNKIVGFSAYQHDPVLAYNFVARTNLIRYLCQWSEMPDGRKPLAYGFREILSTSFRAYLCDIGQVLNINTLEDYQRLKASYPS